MSIITVIYSIKDLIMTELQISLVNIVELLYQTYAGVNTIAVKSAQSKLQQIAQSTQFGKCVNKILKNQQIDPNIKKAAANYLEFVSKKYYIRLIDSNQQLFNFYIALVKNIISDAQISGKYKDPIIRTSFFLTLKLQQTSPTNYRPLAESVAYFSKCNAKRTALAMNMLSELLRLRSQKVDISAQLKNIDFRKIDSLKKLQIYDKTLKPMVESIYIQMTNINVQGVSSDGYTHFQQFIIGWLGYCSMLCQFDFIKYYQFIHLFCNSQQFIQILEFTTLNTFQQNNELDKCRTYSLRLMAHIIRSLGKLNEINKYHNLSELIMKSAERIWKIRIQENAGFELPDAETNLLIVMIKWSNFGRNQVYQFESNYIFQKLIVPISKHFSSYFSIRLENSLDEICECLEMLRLCCYQDMIESKSSSIEYFQLTQHPIFLNQISVLRALLSKIPDLQVKMMNSLYLHSDQNLFESLNSPQNTIILLSFLLAKNFLKYQNFIAQIQKYILQRYEEYLLLSITNLCDAVQQKNLLFLLLYCTFADEILIDKPSTSHQIPEVLLKTALSTQSKAISFTCLLALEQYLINEYPFQHQHERITKMMLQMHSALQKYAQNPLEDYSEIIKKVCTICLHVISIYHKQLGYSYTSNVINYLSDFCHIIDINIYFKTIQKIFSSQFSSNDGQQLFYSSIFNVLLPKLLSVDRIGANDSQQLVKHCSAVIISGLKLKRTNMEQVQQLKNLVFNFLGELIQSQNFPRNHAQTNNLFIYNLFWVLRPHSLGPNNSPILLTLLKKSLYYLRQIDCPKLTYEVFPGDNQFSVIRFLIMIHWIIRNYPQIIDYEHIEYCLLIFDKLTQFMKLLTHHGLGQAQKHFFIGKINIIILLLMLKIPQKTVQVMEKFKWRGKIFEQCDRYWDHACWTIFKNAELYAIQYDIPLIVIEIVGKFKQNIGKPKESVDYFTNKCAHLYLKICMECIEKAHLRNTSIQKQTAQMFKRIQFSNLSSDGYENDVSEDSDVEDCQQAFTCQKFNLQYKEALRIYEEMGFYNPMSLSKQNQAVAPSQFINCFLGFFSKLQQIQGQWVEKVSKNFINGQTLKSIQTIQATINWKINSNTIAKKNRIIFKVKNDIN